MIFPARNLHLFWGFSMAMLNNQMVNIPFNQPFMKPEIGCFQKKPWLFFARNCPKTRPDLQMFPYDPRWVYA
jgi:hypothetical protein